MIFIIQGLLEKIGGIEMLNLLDFLVAFFAHFAAQTVDGAFAKMQAATRKLGHAGIELKFVRHENFTVPVDENSVNTQVEMFE